MRRITRITLDPDVIRKLTNHQVKADTKRAAGYLNIEQEWKSARQTKPLKAVHGALRTMAGNRERCMYCCDSHGTDIEHFWPKWAYPERMFQWVNLLLCCTECGRFKGDRFPLSDGMPGLVDPTVDNPWQFLDFDPATGVIVARYDLATQAESPKGAETVRLLQLDRREALNEGYLTTWRRLAAILDTALSRGVPDVKALSEKLKGADDHGLLGWCFTGTGQQVIPFSTLRAQFPDVWATCSERFS